MRNVDFRVDESVVLNIRRLDGSLVSTRAGGPVFDDKTSFFLRIRSGEIAISAASLADVMNRYVFAAPDAPLKEVSIRIEGNRIRQKATLRKTGLPIEILGELDVTSEGSLRLRPTSIRLAGIPVKGLMSFLRLRLTKVVDLKKARGLDAAGEDIILSPNRMLPPPTIEGRISAVRLERDRVVQIFGSEKPRRRSGSNFMHYQGGTLKFGKLTMDDADLEIIDADPADPFDFFLDHYKEQLVAGYSKTTPTFGLWVFMPDFAKLGPRAAGPGERIR